MPWTCSGGVVNLVRLKLGYLCTAFVSVCSSPITMYHAVLIALPEKIPVSLDSLVYWEGAITALTWKHILINQSFKQFQMRDILPHHDRVCRILHAYRLLSVGTLKITVRFSIHYWKCSASSTTPVSVVLGKGSGLLPSERNKLNFLLQRERLNLSYMYL